jgi:hypothetical protein
MANAGNSPAISQDDRLRNAAAVQSQRTVERLQVIDNAGQSGSAVLEQSEIPVHVNSGSALDSELTLSRADSATSIGSTISGETGDKTHRELSVLLNSVKQSTTTSNDQDSVTQPPVQQIDQSVESERLTSSLKKENSLPASHGVKHDSIADLRLSKSKEKEEEKISIKAFVDSNKDLVEQLTKKSSIRQKSSGSNEPNTPRAESKPITPNMVDKAREKLQTSISEIDETNSEKFQLAEIDMTTETLKEAISSKIDENNLDSLPVILKTPNLLTSFRKILRIKQNS